MFGLMFSWKRKAPKIDFYADIQKKIHKFRLVERAKAAIRDNTNYDLYLRNFLLRNINNQKLIVDVAGHMNYLHRCGLTTQLAAKETLEKYQH